MCTHLSGVGLIAAERERQTGREGYDNAHDDEHKGGEITGAAIAYAVHGFRRAAGDECGWGERELEFASLEQWWPWDATEFKPIGDPIRDLTKAGALIAAEIDRLLRANVGTTRLSRDGERLEEIAGLLEEEASWLGGDPALQKKRRGQAAFLRGLATRLSPENSEDGFEHCKRCGRGNTVWFAPSPLWNAVMRDGSIDGDPIYNDLVCATCFMEIAEEKGIASAFKVYAEQVNVELETTTPSGRVWDEKRGVWSEPAENSSGVEEGLPFRYFQDGDEGRPDHLDALIDASREVVRLPPMARVEIEALLADSQTALASKEMFAARAAGLDKLRAALTQPDSPTQLSDEGE